MNHSEATLGGGYVSEEDNCAHCTVCQQQLAYTLTDYGMRTELDHFRRRRFRTAPSADEVYQIARMLGAASNNPLAMTIAQRTIAALTKFAPKPHR